MTRSPGPSKPKLQVGGPSGRLLALQASLTLSIAPIRHSSRVTHAIASCTDASYTDAAYTDASYTDALYTEYSYTDDGDCDHDHDERHHQDDRTETSPYNSFNC